MSRHATATVLSAYLDEELDAEELESVECHLEECEPCREQLISMRRVVAALRGLQRQAPSPVLGQTVVRRVQAYPQPRGLVERAEDRLLKLRLDGSPFVTFALVLAFAVILMVFAQSVQRSSERTRLVILPSVQQVVLAERIFERRDGVWIAQGAERPGARVIDAETVEGRTLLAEMEGVYRLLEELPVVFELETGETVELRRLEDQSP